MPKVNVPAKQFASVAKNPDSKVTVLQIISESAKAQAAFREFRQLVKNEPPPTNAYQSLLPNVQGGQIKNTRGFADGRRKLDGIKIVPDNKIVLNKN